MVSKSGNSAAPYGFPIAVLLFAAALLASETAMGQVDSLQLDPNRPLLTIPDEPNSRIDTGQGLQPSGNSSRGVVVDDLPPLDGDDTDSRPLENDGFSRAYTESPGFWRGLNLRALETSLAGLSLTPKSATAQSLLIRLLETDEAGPDNGGRNALNFELLRLEALYQMGQTRRVASIGNVGAFAKVIVAKALLAEGKVERACGQPAKFAVLGGNAPRQLRRDAAVIGLYCTAKDGHWAAARLRVERAKSQGLSAAVPFSIVEAMATGAKPRGKLPKRLTLLDFMFLKLAGVPFIEKIMQRAEPALLVAAALDGDTELAMRLRAGERAARIGAIGDEVLAQLYLQAGERANTTGNRRNGARAMQRAELFLSLKQSDNLRQRLRAIQQMFDLAERDDLALPVARALLADVQSLRQSDNLGWFAETAIRIGIAAGDHRLALSWAIFSGTGGTGRGNAMHWMALTDVGSAPENMPKGAGLGHITRLAVANQVAPQTLHVLVTVLDALAYNVPIPLWQAASQTPQPTTGHLPETGVLSHLTQAVETNQPAKVILLTLDALGDDGPVGSHMLALGDAVRALRQAGFNDEAQRLAVEALYPIWPRTRR